MIEFIVHLFLYIYYYIHIPDSETMQYDVFYL